MKSLKVKPLAVEHWAGGLCWAIPNARRIRAKDRNLYTLEQWRKIQDEPDFMPACAGGGRAGNMSFKAADVTCPSCRSWLAVARAG